MHASSLRRGTVYLVGITAASLAAAFFWVGCGSSTTDNGNGTPDAAFDAPQDAPQDTSLPQDTGVDAPTDAGCGADVDLNTIQPPDADINDAGANTVLCVNCLRSNCHAEISECNADCT